MLARDVFPAPPPLRSSPAPHRNGTGARICSKLVTVKLRGSRGSAEGQSSIEQQQMFRRLIARYFHVSLKRKTAVIAFNKRVSCLWEKKTIISNV